MVLVAILRVTREDREAFVARRDMALAAKIKWIGKIVEVEEMWLKPRGSVERQFRESREGALMGLVEAGYGSRSTAHECC